MTGQRCFSSATKLITMTQRQIRPFLAARKGACSELFDLAKREGQILTLCTVGFFGVSRALLSGSVGGLRKLLIISKTALLVVMK